MEIVQNMWTSMAIDNLYWGNFVMWGIAFTFIYLAIKKGFEPLLLLPIAFGILLVNLPSDIMMPEQGLLWRFYHYGEEWAVIPPLIFLGIGAMTDFGPVIANPKTLLLGAGAQGGVYVTFFGALALGFNIDQALIDKTKCTFYHPVSIVHICCYVLVYQLPDDVSASIRQNIF